MVNVLGLTRVTNSAVEITNAMVVTGSAYASGDSLGWPYEIPYAVGNQGGLLTQSTLYIQSASGITPFIRVHFYGQSASGVTAGVAHAVDVDYHLGYVDHTAWVTGGGQLLISQVDKPNLSLDNFTPTNARSVWATLESFATAWGFGATANPMKHKIGVLQD